ncbi:MAG: 23S rRNA (adenine(2503)-C(2))-methyltransferase RlmN [Nitrospirae bacterium]|nr:23S rRNA (adenine(2503)-C(2))-methyltransferase RlmN [Nitrospirota bacterium]
MGIGNISASISASIVNLKALTKEELRDLFESLSLPEFRDRQLLKWIYEKRCTSISDITEFSKPLRQRLEAIAYIGNLDLTRKLLSADGTAKYLFRLEDGDSIESVLIPEAPQAPQESELASGSLPQAGRMTNPRQPTKLPQEPNESQAPPRAGRLTLCISSQAGCRMGCRFCLTGATGFRRNLGSFEIIDQVLSVERDVYPGRHVTNVVIMGMGEPLDNFREVVRALWILTEQTGISKRRITLSTSGLVPEMARLFKEAPEVNLAISLNGTTNEQRQRVMPVNARYPIETLLSACRKLPLSPRRRITFEYVMLRGINDSMEDAVRLCALIKGIPSKVNLIPFNDYAGSVFKRPDDQNVLRFQEILTSRHVTAFIRKSMGADILAACGQLRGPSSSA